VVGLCFLLAASVYEAVRYQALPEGKLLGPASGVQLAPPVTVMPTDPATSMPAQIVNMTPDRLVIPSLSLDARVEARGLDSHRNLATASDFHDVAWYNLGPAPGQPGNAVINGHVNWWTGDAVFTHLGQIRVGDQVEIIRADGMSVWFTVTAKRMVPANSRIATLFAPSAGSTLTLITCAGIWNPFTQSDTQRLLVSAVLA
jgi:LPXTG-site transpeptidase (sortase) family protein